MGRKGQNSFNWESDRPSTSEPPGADETATIHVATHLDPIALERELLARLHDAHPAGEAARTLVLVPTRRLVEHVQRRLCERRPAWLGLDVMHFTVLSHTMIQHTAAQASSLASPRLHRALLGSVLEALPQNRWSDFVRRRPGSLRRLSSAVGDLREAGIPPERFRSSCAAGLEREFSEVYARYCDELSERASRGWIDEAGLVERALPGAPKLAARYGAIFLYGAYELIGIHLDLVRALARNVDVTALVVARDDAPVSTYAEQFARRYLASGGDPSAVHIVDPTRAELLATLYDEEARPAPEPDLFTFRHAQGAAAEVRVAVRSAMRAVHDGCTPRDVAIVARNLAPYAAALEEILDDEGIPWTSSLTGPLRRLPVVRDFLLALRVVDEDFPRAATVELLRSGRFDWPRIAPGTPRPRGHVADRWSRAARILGGLEEWTEDLPLWAGVPHHRDDATDVEREQAQERARQRREEAQILAATLRALRDRLQPDRPATWNEHAALLENLSQCLLVDEDERARLALGALGGLLDEMRGMQEFVGQSAPVPFRTMRAWIEEAVEGAEIAEHGADHGGLRVLDLMQLRGLTFKRIYFLGMNAGLFPRAPREDPLLPDRLRRRLAEQSRRPLPVKSDGGREERLLLSLLLGSASDRIEISWQRADESGKVKTASPALRELARVARGRPDAAALTRESTRLPAHPLFALQALEEQPGLLSPADESLLIALRGDGPHCELLELRFPKLAPGLRMLRETESFAPTTGSYDARAGGLGTLPDHYSVSALEMLGGCPLRYFFRRVLRVRELDEQASLLEISSREMGIEIHRLLQSVYETLHRENRFEDDLASRRGRARELVNEGWTNWMGGLGRRLEQRLPLLWEHHRAEWIEALHAFVDEDLERLDHERWLPAEFEVAREAELDFGGAHPTRVVGRLDRVFAGPDGTLVGDYKTSGKLGRRVDISQMVKGQTLQVPLYSMLMGHDSRVEMLGVGPSYSTGDEADAANRRAVFTSFENDDQRAGFVETMRGLLGQREAECFPLNPSDGLCGFCAYVQACRRTHPPTLEREFQVPQVASFRRLDHKNKSNPRNKAPESE